MHLQARVWYNQRNFEEAKSEGLRAVGVYERIGFTKDAEDCRALLRDIETEMRNSATSAEPDFNGEPLGTALLPTFANSSF